jgi:uncharacterized protein RhaS with RHS repeats
MYDPSIGRWLEEDPIDFDGGDADLYRAMGNDPVNLTDPSGLFTGKPQSGAPNPYGYGRRGDGGGAGGGTYYPPLPKSTPPVPSPSRDEDRVQRAGPTLFPNRASEERKKVDEEAAKNPDVGPKALKEQIFVVKTRKDLTDNFKPGEPFKYVIVDGIFVAIKHKKGVAEAPHSFGTLKVKGKVGLPVEAAGMAVYSTGKKDEFLGIRFDLETGHYKISRQKNWQVGRDQALLAFLMVTGPDGKPGGLPATYTEKVPEK